MATKGLNVRHELIVTVTLDIYVHLNTFVGTQVGQRPKERETNLWRFPMSTVEVMGRLRAQKKMKRDIIELSHHQEQEMSSSHHWMTEHKAGKCYTYRGVQYCYQ